MALFLIILAIAFFGLIFGPQFWVAHVIKKHAEPRPDLPGTGGELAEHLIEHFQLQGVGVERIPAGDHYDPESRTVRLSEANYDGTSLSAVAIATHEVGHAIQHMRGESLLMWRQRLAHTMIWADRIGSGFLLLAPLFAGLTRAPSLLLLMAAVGIGLMALRVVVHLVTLPVEYDASFKKALPILEAGGYLDERDMPAARQVLKAAALTYVAAALMSMLNFARLIRVFR
ncbi:MAG: zinc metallopeptidase [Pseudomonadota bacterium]